MTWWSWRAASIAVAFIVVGFALLGRAAVQIYGTMRLGAPDPHRAGPVGRGWARW